MHAYYSACSSSSGHSFSIKLCCFSCMYFGLFIISKQTTNYANLTQSNPFSRFQNDFLSVEFQRLLCSLCSFDKSSKATGYASLSVVCQQEMNGYVELYPELLYPVSSEEIDHRESRRAEVNNKEKSDLESPRRNPSAILTSDI